MDFPRVVGSYYMVDCYCCPPSVARTTAKLHDWVYSTSEEGLWVHLYGGSRLATTLADGSPVELTQETDYPWSPEVTLRVERAGRAPFAIFARIPGWCRGASVKVNGRPLDAPAEPGTYVKVRRKWAAGDRIELHFPLEARLMAADPRVEKLRGMAAAPRGVPAWPRPGASATMRAADRRGRWALEARVGPDCGEST